MSQLDVALYVGNLAKSVSENELRNLFSRVGEVTRLRIMTDGDSGESKEYGFITMSSQNEADRAVSQFDHYLLSEHRLRVSAMSPRMIRGGRRLP